MGPEQADEDSDSIGEPSPPSPPFPWPDVVAMGGGPWDLGLQSGATRFAGWE